MGDIAEYRYEHWSLPTKFDWLRSGAGPAGAHDGAFALGRFAGSVAQVDANIRAALGALGVAWQGRAATRAADALQCTADDAADVAAFTEHAATRADDYGGSFAGLRNAVPAPVPEGENSFGGMLLDGFRAAQDWASEHLSTGRSVHPGVLVDVQSDYQRRVDANAAAEEAANAAFKAHEEATRAALRAIPEPPAPPVPAADAGQASATGSPGTHGGPGVGAGDPVVAAPGAGGQSAGAGGPGGRGAAAGDPDGGGAAAAGGIGGGAPGAGVPSSGSGAMVADPGGAAGTASAGAASGQGVPPSGSPVPPSPPPPVSSGSVPPPMSVPTHPGPTPVGRDAAPPLGSTGRSGSSPRFGAPAGVGGFDEPLAQRGGQAPPGGQGQLAGAASSQRPGHLPAGAAPMGALGGAGAQGRTHRNESYLPDDEPFRVEPEGVTPPVLGVAGEDPW